MFSPRDYLDKLNEIDSINSIEIDYYYKGGVTRELEDEFARITGKEKAIYLPTGTMANQLALKLLNGSNTKAIVPENSHVFRDEADASQAVSSLTGKEFIHNNAGTLSVQDKFFAQWIRSK